jgi:hypothetical protein
MANEMVLHVDGFALQRMSDGVLRIRDVDLAVPFALFFVPGAQPLLVAQLDARGVWRPAPQKGRPS